MQLPHAAYTLVLFTALTGSVGAAAPEPAATKPIAQLIAELDDDNFIVRERATRLLIARGPEVLEPLKEAVKSNDSPELQARARHVIQALSTLDGGGKVVHGLKIRLRCDVDRVRPGSKVLLTTTLCNVTDSDLNVQVGFGNCGNYFECGSNLHVLDTVGRPGKTHWRSNLCATGTGPIFVTVPARGTLEFTSRMQLQIDDEQLVYAGKYAGAVAPRAGTHRLCMTLSAAAGQENLPAAGMPPANTKAHFWTGDLRSNIIELEVVH